MTEASETIVTEQLEGGEATDSAVWLARITEAERAFHTWQDKCDLIDKTYADLEEMANSVREREFQMFWANIQVLAPSVYSRPPIPVVMQRFRERRPVPRTASELLERCAVVTFEQTDIDAVMRLVRDDMLVNGRGVPWARYEAKKEKGKLVERVVIDHVDRKDFVHAAARKWPELPWGARRAWMTRDEMAPRFKPYSGDAYKNAAFEERQDDKLDGGVDRSLKAGVWEIWSRTDNRVYWVTEGVDVLLDSGEPHLVLEGFFPFPRPAYGTLQRRTMIPVPDRLFYRDQLEEINELTARISALSDALRLKGFYPSGAAEIGDAIEAAIKSTENRAILVPISNWAAFGGMSAKDSIIWLPIDMVATVIAQLIEIRRQTIDDVYQITGLSDIMRGATDANETLGAQELKSQYGSIRIKDRQAELVRIARDLTRIACEIMAENFQGQTLLDMSQMELPTDADIRKQIKALEQQAQQVQTDIAKQVQQAQSDPRIMQAAQQDPQKAQQVIAQVQQQAEQQMAALRAKAQELGETVTIDKVMALLREQRLRPFALDIETDSTIAPDENAQKQRATEFITATGAFMNQMVVGIESVPEMAPLMAEALKYVSGQFRAGRPLEGAIDEFAEKMKERAANPKPNPEAEAAQAAAQAEQQRMQADVQAKAADAQIKAQQAQMDAEIKQRQAATDLEAKVVETNAKLRNMDAEDHRAAEAHTQALQKGGLELEKLKLEIARVGIQTQADVVKTEAQVEATRQTTAAGIEAQRAGTEIKAQAAKKEPA